MRTDPRAFLGRPGLAPRGPFFRLVLAACCWISSAQAQEPTVSPEELSAIEKALAEDAAAAPKAPAPAPAPAPVFAALQSLNPDLAFITDVSLAAFGDERHLQTGGHDPTRNGFNLQQLELAVGAAVDPFFRFDGNLVFTPFGVELEEAYATTLALPYHLQARVGQLLTRFGRHNPTHPHTWAFVDQPFALGRVFGGEGNRALGLEASWLAPTPWYVELVASATEAGGEGTARSFFGAQSFPVMGPLDLQLTVALKQFFELSDAWSLNVGLSAANGPNGTGHDTRTDVYGLDVYVKFRPLVGTGDEQWAFQAELVHRRRQIPHDLLADFGGYAWLSYKPNKRWAYAARYEHGSAPVDRSGRVRGDDLDPDWTGARHRVSANATYYPTEFSRLRLQGSVDLPSWRPAPIWAVFLAAEFSVGAHGAHVF